MYWLKCSGEIIYYIQTFEINETLFGIVTKTVDLVPTPTNNSIDFSKLPRFHENLFPLIFSNTNYTIEMFSIVFCNLIFDCKTRRCRNQQFGVD